MSDAVTGHVFVLQGRIGSVVSDADIVSTDGVFTVESHWDAALGIAEGVDRYTALRHMRPSGWPGAGYGQSRASNRTWFIDVAAREYAMVTDRLHQLLEQIAEWLRPEGEGRKRHLPLITMPLLGVGQGGWDGVSGMAINAQLAVCQAFVENHAIDVAIVSPSSGSYGALQHQRRVIAAPHDHALERKLGGLAREGALALFIGAGASVPSGLPSWKDLLAELLSAATERGRGLTDDELSGFAKLDALDQAQLLHQVLGDSLGQRVATIITGDGSSRPAVAHVLLAALTCREAVTTNYDSLYERAVAACGLDDAELAVVLPHELPQGRRRWLLKMHGSVEQPDRIVLSRSQFTGFDASAGPSGAVLQSLLLTRHLLVVGTSMKDPNVLRLIDGVVRYRGDHADPTPTGELPRLGTILDVSGEPIRKRLHGAAFDWVDMPGGGIEAAARNLEIYLDRIAMYAADDMTWLLDPKFVDLHPDGEDRDRARELAAWAAALPAEASAPGWQKVADQFRAWGAHPRR